jgi:hypothetical protein
MIWIIKSVATVRKIYGKNVENHSKCCSGCHPSSCCNRCISTEIELFLLWGANIWVFARCKYTRTTSSGMRSHKHSNLRSITIDIHTKRTAERKSDSTDHSNVSGLQIKMFDKDSDHFPYCEFGCNRQQHDQHAHYLVTPSNKDLCIISHTHSVRKT